MRERVVIEGEWEWIGADPPTVEERAVIEDVDVVSAETVRAPTLGELLRAERERQGVGLDQIEAASDRGRPARCPAGGGVRACLRP